MRAGRLPRGGVRVDRPVLGMSVQGGVKHAAAVAGSVFQKKKKKSSCAFRAQFQQLQKERSRRQYNRAATQ